MRVVFIGTPAFAAPSLRALLESEDAEVVGVFTRPERRAGRGRKPTPSAIEQLALAHHLAVFQPESFDRAALDALMQLAPTLIVVVAFGLRLPPDALRAAKLGCVNLHASLLPRWRGAAPIARAIEAGDSHSGITLMQMNQGVDQGAMLACAKIPIADDDTAASLHDKLAQLAAQLLRDNLTVLRNQTLTPRAQDESRACYARKLTAADAPLDWRQDARVLERKVRAFYPTPVAHGTLNKVALRVLRASIGQSRAGTCGEIVRADASGIDVATGDGVLRLDVLQKPGGRPMAARDLLNGMTIAPGMRFTAMQC